MHRWYRFFHLVVLWTGAQWLAENAVGLSDQELKVLTAAALVAWPVLWFRRVSVAQLLSVPGILWPMGVIAGCFASEPVSVFALSAIAIAGYGGLGENPSPVYRQLAIGFAVYLCCWCVYLLEPRSFSVITSMASSYGNLLGEMTVGRSLNMGPTLHGFWALLLVVSPCLIKFGFGERQWLTLAGVLGWIGLVQVGTDVAIHVNHKSLLAVESLRWVPLLYHGIAILPVAWCFSRVSSVNHQTDRRGRAWPAMATACTAFCLLLLVQQTTQNQASRVVFYRENEGPIVNFERPNYEKVGLLNLGLFGLMPTRLEEDGFIVDFLTGEVDARKLDDADVLVTINANTQWKEAELTAVWDFVERGGSLLMLGDHTDVFGSQASQNALLQPFGIEFRFDSGLPEPKVGFQGGDLFASAALASIDRPYQLAIGIGATLALNSPNARPLVSGRYSLADLGNQAAADRAFLGDYQYQPGEPIGDIVLAAEAELGAGRAIVFGDTSPFQNSAITMSYDDLVRPLFQHLSGQPFMPVKLPTATLAVVFLGSVILLLWHGHSGALIPLTFVIVGGLTGGKGLQELQFQNPPRVAPIAWIDQSHQSRIDSVTAGKNCVFGLVVNLQRMGFRVRTMEEFEAQHLKPGDVFVTIAPLMQFNPQEVDQLFQFAEQGGVILAAGGTGQHRGLTGFLDRLGVSLGDAPIGSVPLQREPGRTRIGVEFVEAWPLEIHPDIGVGTMNIESAFEGVPLAASCRLGAGGVFFVADTYFFSAQNLEGIEEHSMPNIAFLRRIVRSLRGEDPS